MNIDEIQRALREEGVNGWLFFDHHGRDPLAYRVLRLPPKREVTRRWYYLIPAIGEPRGLVHQIERGILDELPGHKRTYSRWSQQLTELAALLKGLTSVAMQYSPNCAVPYVSMVDAGTVDLVRSLGVEVRSSANLIQYFEARWCQSQLEAHLEAARRVDQIRRCAFSRIGEQIRAGEAVSEWDIKCYILEAFDSLGLVTDHGPIVAVNANSSNPHYEPSAEANLPIRSGDWVLIDMWAKLDVPEGVYYDVTWTGYCGDQVPSPIERVFHTVVQARDRAVECVQAAVAAGRAICGFQVDEAARAYIESQGYGEYFVHRTGHSIGREVHGTGANMDNYETHDERRVVPWTCFSM